MRARAVTLPIAVLLLACAGIAQSPPRPAFEVASIKPSPNCTVTGRGGPSPGRLELPCVTLRGMIRMAYATFTGEQWNARRVEVVGGPGWLDSERYQLIAKAEGQTSGPLMMGPMLQALLEDRFQLKVHAEARESPVFVLTVAKPGKLAPAKEGSCVPIDWNNLPRPDASGSLPNFCGGAKMRGTPRGLIADVPGSTMAEFAGRVLAPQVRRQVVDKTGLAGRFDLHVEFTLEYESGTYESGTLLNGVPAPALPPARADGFPSIFTALEEQLGLKLSSGKAPLDVIVVDSASKPILD